MKSRQETIDDFRHAVSGILCDFIKSEPRGAELSVALRAALKKIDALAAAFYDQLLPAKPPAATNGQAQPRKVTT